MKVLVAENKNIITIMLIIGIICLLTAFFVSFLYKKKISKEKNNKGTFTVKEIQAKYKIFHFWSHIVYIFIIFTLFIVAIIFMTIGISSLLN